MINFRADRRTPIGIRIASALCLGIVIVAPLPVGGFRPQWWLTFALISFLATAIVLSSMLANHRQARLLTAAAPGLAITYALFLLLLCTHVLIVGGAASDADALYGLLRQLSFCAVGWTLLQAVTSAHRATNYAQILTLAIFVYAVYGLFTIDRPEWLTFTKTQYHGFATGPFVNRNSFATFLAMGMSLVLACALADDTGIGRERRRGHKISALEGKMRAILLITIAMICLAGVLATGSRMGLFVTLAGGSVVTALRLKRLASNKVPISFLAVSAILLAASLISMLAILYGGGVADRLGSTLDNASVRIDLYRNILDMIAAYPLHGVGLDNFGEAFRRFQRLPVSPDADWNLAHNTYLSLWSELGIILGSLPIFLFTIVGWALLRRSVANDTSPASHLSDAAFAAIVIAALHSLVDFSLEMPANAYLLIALVVLGLGPLPSKSARRKGEQQ